MDGTASRILLVEDNEAHIALIHRAFESRATCGCRLSVSRSLRDARRLLVDFQPDLIIADLRLPDGEGIDLIPKRPRDRAYPVVIMTSFGDEAVAVQVMKAGALDYVVKSEAMLKDIHHVAERTLREWGHILERQRVEQELHQEKQYNAYIVAAAPTLICCVSPQGITTSINRAVTTITGYTPDDLVGKPFWRMLYPGKSYQQVQQLFMHLDQGPVVNHETVLTTKDGSKRTVLWSSVRRLDPSGRLREVVGIGADVTDQKQLTQQLRQSQKLEVVGTLASGVAHDIHNMLAVIHHHVELTQRSLPDHHPALRSIKIIERMARRSDAAMRSLLTFASKRSFKKSPVDLAVLIGESVQWLRDLMPSSIKIVHDQPNGLRAWIYSDPTQIHQVLMNLAVNARDAMPRGGELRITLHHENPVNERSATGADPSASAGTDQDSQILLVVEDTGHGIPPQTIERIFEPFFTTKDKEEGTGLGLSMVYGIMQDLQGRIEVDSQVERGTRLRLFFPSLPPPPPDMPQDSLRRQDSPESVVCVETVGRGKSVMVVQPDRQTRSIMASTLRRQGFKVLQASDADQALAQLDPSRVSSPVHLVVVDVDPPAARSGAWLERISRVCRGVPVIVVGDGLNAESRRLLDGQYSSLLKPYQMSQLAHLATRCVTPNAVEQPTR